MSTAIVTLRLTERLKEKVAELAREDGRSMNGWIAFQLQKIADLRKENL